MLSPFTSLYGYYLPRYRAIIRLSVPDPTFLLRPRIQRCNHESLQQLRTETQSYDYVFSAFLRFSNILSCSALRILLLASILFKIDSGEIVKGRILSLGKHQWQVQNNFKIRKDDLEFATFTS